MVFFFGLKCYIRILAITELFFIFYWSFLKKVKQLSKSMLKLCFHPLPGCKLTTSPMLNVTYNSSHKKTFLRSFLKYLSLAVRNQPRHGWKKKQRNNSSLFGNSLTWTRKREREGRKEIIVTFNGRTRAHLLKSVSPFVFTQLRLFYLLKMGQPRPLLLIFSLFTIFTTNLSENMSIQYSVTGFEPTTFRT